MNISKQYDAVTLTPTTIVAGKKTVLQLTDLRGLGYSLESSSLCSAIDNGDGTLTVIVSENISDYMRPTINLVIYADGYTGRPIQFTLNIQKPVVTEDDFELHSASFTPHKKSNIILTGPSGYSYRLITNKVGNGILDHEFVETDTKWVPINRRMGVTMKLSNGLTLPHLRFECRNDRHDTHKTMIISRAIGSVKQDQHYRFYDAKNTAATLMKVGELLIKGQDPIATRNPYVAGIASGGDVYQTAYDPTMADNNVSTLQHPVLDSMSIQIEYGIEPAIRVLKSRCIDIPIGLGVTIYKKGKARKGFTFEIPFDLQEGDVVMKFQDFSYFPGQVLVLLRKPEDNVIWRKGKDTKVRVIGGGALSICGGTLPNNIPLIHRDFLAGTSVIIDYVPPTGFVQTT